MYVCIYTCRRVNPIVLSRGRRLGRAAPRYFQFRAAVSSRARSDEAIGNSPRRDFQHFQFARGSSLAGRIHTVTGKEPDGHSFPHSLSLSPSSAPVLRKSAFRCAVTITGIQAGCCTPRSRTGNHCVSHGPKAFRIYRSRRRAERFGPPEICTFLLFILVSRILPSRRYFLRGGNALPQP